MAIPFQSIHHIKYSYHIIFYTLCIHMTISKKKISRLQPIVITDPTSVWELDDRHIAKKNSLYPTEYEGHLENILISSRDIRVRTLGISQLIAEDYKNKRPLLLYVLQSSSMFFYNLLSDLQKLRFGYTYDFIRAKSYEGHDGIKSFEITSDSDLSTSVRDRDIIIVEDIIDEGETTEAIMSRLEQYLPKSIQICTLLETQSEIREKTQIVSKYAGFSIPDKFVVGYGLSYDKKYRDLADIWILCKKLINSTAKQIPLE